jgi:hypothetical protein
MLMAFDWYSLVHIYEALVRRPSRIVRRTVFPSAMISTIISRPFGDAMLNPRGKGMHRLRRLWLPLLAISFLTPTQGKEVGEGVIQGVVLGQGGQPVRGAKVHAELNGAVMAKKIRYVETDESGFFIIDRLDFGKYYGGAMKEEEGYGNSDSSFFNDNPLPVVRLLFNTGLRMWS